MATRPRLEFAAYVVYKTESRTSKSPEMSAWRPNLSMALASILDPILGGRPKKKQIPSQVAKGRNFDTGGH